MRSPHFHIWAVINATAGLEGSIFLRKTGALEIQICHILLQVIGPLLKTKATWPFTPTMKTYFQLFLGIPYRLLNQHMQ